MIHALCLYYILLKWVFWAKIELLKWQLQLGQKNYFVNNLQVLAQDPIVNNLQGLAQDPIVNNLQGLAQDPINLEPPCKLK